MTADNLSDAELLVREGMNAAWTGDRTLARELLNLAISLEQDNVEAWLGLSDVMEDAVSTEFCLRRVLALDPDNRTAGRRLARLGRQAWRQDRARLLRDAGGGGQGGLAPAAGAAGAAADAGGSGAPSAVFREEPPERAGLIIRNEFVLTALLGLALLALIVLGAEGRPAPPALALLRLLLGLAYVLFVPGYALQAALFPRAGDLDGPERLALSFGLSVAVVPLLALVLDRLPWGIRLWPIVAGEGLIIALWAAVAVFRRRRLAEDERPVLVLHVDARGWWAGQDRTGRVLYGVLAGALLLASVSAAAIILSPRPGELFTEFYVLGPEGLAEAYPRQARPGEPLAVTAGIANREGQAAQYRIEVQAAGETIGGAGPIALGDGEVWEAALGYALPRAGEDQQVDLLLYRDGGAEPYRRLRLWIDVVAGGGP